MGFQKLNIVQYSSNVEATNEAKIPYVECVNKFNYSDLIEEVLTITPEVWDTEYQNSPNINKSSKALSQTRHIVFKFSYKHKDKPFEYFDLPIWDEWKDRLLPIMNKATEKYGYKNAIYPRVLLAILPAGAIIPPHSDGGEFRSRPHKIHIPITTNEHTFFMHPPGRKYQLEVGSAYEVNNCIPHAVENKGETNRIHLIFEYMPLEDNVQTL